MHFSCLVITGSRPDEGAIDELMWPWCFSNEERREAKVDYWEAAGGRFANAFSLEDVPAETDFTKVMIGPGNRLLKKDVPFEGLTERGKAVLTYAVVKGTTWHECNQGGQPSAWEQEFAALLDAVDPDWWLTIVDCHR